MLFNVGHPFAHEELCLSKERNDNEYTMKDLLKEYKLKNLTLNTVYRWLELLGFRYKPRKKSYYVDSHESEENVNYRNSFVSRNFQYELRCHRWIVLSKRERDELVVKGDILEELGYRFEKNNEIFFEYHVDDQEIFQHKCSHLPYGGHLSVRKPPHLKPLMLLGQDECIFKQFVFTRGFWVLPDGTRQLVPKEEGQGVMLSSFCSRELGYGFPLTQDVLEAVNKQCENTHYSDTIAASIRFGTSLKPLLATSPFVRELDYGNGNDGYWSYEHMVVQIEDCIDVLRHTHPQFYFIFLLDNSNGHDRLQPDRLSITKINIRHAGKQPRMRSSKLTHQEFGPFHTSDSKLQPNDIQSMQFSESDPGPCYLSEQERIEQRLDMHLDKQKKRDLTKVELMETLKARGNNSFGTKKSLQEKCTKLGIPFSVQVPVVREGWVGKPKGSLQILFERCWIHPDLIHLYTAEGKRSEQPNIHQSNILPDPTGCNYSIKSLMKLQADFRNEVTLLQFHAAKLGVSVDRTPKCHPELAGEGIEYTWALAKLKYRSAPIGDKISKANFRKLVVDVTYPLDNLY